jgi:hypothetical protein
MWTRFNFLLTIDSALFALSVNGVGNTDAAAFTPLFVGIGIVLSVLWYWFGATDNYLGLS